MVGFDREWAYVVWLLCFALCFAVVLCKSRSLRDLVAQILTLVPYSSMRFVWGLQSYTGS